MKNIFSPKLYLQGLRKVRTLGIAMAIVMIALNAWIPLMCMNTSNGFVDGEAVITAVEAGMFAPFGLLFLVFAPLLVYNMFSYLNERKSSDFFHALPQKRICVYISFMSAILTWILSVLLLSTVVNSVLWSAAKYYTVSVDVIVMTTLGFFILALVMAGFMALAMTLTGTAVANCLVFLLFFLFIRAFGLFFLYGLEGITPMFNHMHSWLRIFDWDFFLPLAFLIKILDGGSTNGAFGNVGLLIYWFAVAVLLLIGSALTYCLRKSESATKSAPNKIMQNIYRIGVTFPFMMLGAFLFIDQKDFYWGLLCFVMAFLVWVIFELLTTKKIKNVFRSLPLFLIPVLLTAVYLVSLNGASRFVYHTVPERDEIAGAKIEIIGSHKDLSNAILSLTETTDEETIDRIFEAISCTKESESWSWNEMALKGYIYSETVTLRLRSGRKITYDLRSNFDLYEVFRKAPDIQEQILTHYVDDANIEFAYGADFSKEYGAKIWEAFKEDFNALTHEERLEYFNLYAPYDTGCILYASGSYKGLSFTQQYFLHPVYTPKAMKLCLEYYQTGSAKTLQDFCAVRDEILQYTSDDIQFISMEIRSYIYSDWRSYTTNMQVIQAFLREVSADERLTNYSEAKNVYLVMFRTQTLDEDDEKYGYLSSSLYLTFSEEDLKLYEEIVARYKK